MLLTKEAEQITSAGLGRGNDFKIAASSKAFEILSSNLYQNKTLAVIREISCNAADAHMVANLPLSDIVIHLPTYSEPWFSVRDYGAGLSIEDTLDLYTTYFSSTKDNDNSQIGGFGLGSKSPFAVADQFTVTSWHAGHKSHFVCYKDGGMPKVNMTGSDRSSEPSGIEVRVAARDYDNWHKEARKFFAWWHTLPKINSQDIISIVHDNNVVAKSKLTGTDGFPEWAILKSYDKPHVFMGLVPYALNVSAIPGLPEEISTVFASMPLLLRFNVGDLNISPSREALSYDPNTCDILTKKLREIAAEIIDGVKVKLAAQPTLHAARLYVYQDMAALPTFGPSLLKLAQQGKLKWNGQDIKHQVDVDLPKDFAAHVTMSFYNRPSHRKSWRRSVNNIEWTHTVRQADYQSREHTVYYWTAAITSKTYKTLAHYHDVMMPNPNSNYKTHTTAVIFSGSSLADITSVLADKGIEISIVDVATLPAPPKTIAAKKGSTQTKGYSFGSSLTYSRQEQALDLADGGVYLEFFEGQPTDHYALLCQVHKAGWLPDTTKVLGFRRAQLATKTLQAALTTNKWVRFDGDWFTANVTPAMLQETATGNLLQEQLQYQSQIHYNALLAVQPTNPGDAALFAKLRKVQPSRASNIGTRYDLLLRYYTDAHKKVLLTAAANAKLIKQQVDDFAVRHPLLTHVNFSGSPKTSDLAAYINR
jgi:hypothetical protein